MKLRKLTPAVSMYKEPALGTKDAKSRIIALAIDKKSKDPKMGIAREITEKKPNPNLLNIFHKSKLILVKSDDLKKWEKVEDIKINNLIETIDELYTDNKDFIGIHDVNIYNRKGTKHVYLSIGFKYKNKKDFEIYLGHAKGKSLKNLTATKPVLYPKSKITKGYKEVAISPLKHKKIRINLAEVLLSGQRCIFSTIASVESTSLSKTWVFKNLINLGRIKDKWCNGALSPCCILPKKFLRKNNLLVGIVNGRKPNKKVNGKLIRGKFSPGLILFDYKTGNIPWISPEPLFEDPDAKTATFASEFIQTKKDEGILYCHINGSFVRAYKLKAKELKKLLPKKI